MAESCPKILYDLWYVICAIYGLEKGPIAPIFVHVTSKKGPYMLRMLHKSFTCWKQCKFFILSGNLLLRESPFRNVNCLKLFNFTLFFVYTLKLLNGPFDTHFCFILKNIWLSPELAAPEWFISFYTKQCKNYVRKSQKAAPQHLWLKVDPIRQPRPPSLISTPALNYIQKTELASFYNTIELIKVLCNIIKIFIDHSIMLRIT